MLDSMNKLCRNRIFRPHFPIEVKGTLGFSFWTVIFLASVAIGAPQLAYGQGSLSLLVSRDSGLLRDARAISVAPDGSIYIADTGHNRILQLAPTGESVGEIGDLGREHGQFQWPIDVAAEQGTTIWVSDFGNRRIERFTRRFTWQGSIKLPSQSGDIAAQPGPLAVTTTGDLFVVDQDGQRLLKYNPLGILQAEFGARRGITWVSAVQNLAAHSELGVVWANAERDLVQRMDIFGNAMGDVGRGQLQGPRLVAFGDNTLWVCDSLGLKRADVDGGEFQLVMAMGAMQAQGIQQISDFACQDDSLLYLLDGRQGQLWRAILRSE
jgi:tripartite motif-containing protein 71